MADNNVEELIKTVQAHRGVTGYIIVNSEGIPIRHSFDEEHRLLAIHYAGLMQQLAQKAHAAVEDLSRATNEAGNDLVFIRLRSKKHEILVAPGEKYLLIVIQTPQVG